MRMIPRNLSLMALALVAAPALVAQESTGQVVGMVKSKTGEVMAGVEVRLSAPTLQGVRVVTTDAKGAFRAPLLPPGLYSITPVKAGYVAAKVEVEVGLGQVVRQEILMAQAGGTATVEVVASASSVDKTDVKAATVISSQDMDLLPRTTRGLNTIALLAPGVTTNATGRVQMRGGQGTGNRFLVNGTDISDNAFGTSDGRQFFVDDSVDQTQVILSPISARYGGFTGGVVNAITKVGGNDWTGIFRADLRRTSWAAVAPKGLRPDNVSQPSTGVDDLTRNYSLWMGGPILKDRLWFTVSTKQDPPSSTPTVWSNPTASGATGLITGDTGPGSGGPAYLTNAGGIFVARAETKFYELKLTGSISTDHTVSVSGSYSKNATPVRAYTSSSATGGSFDPAVLSDGYFEYKYYAVNYRGILSAASNLEVNASKKKQKSVSGGYPENGDTIFARYGNGSVYQFNNGIFNHSDGGDNRNIDSYTANYQWFSPQTAIGSHQLDIGFELLRQQRIARNDQSPNNRRFYVWGRNADGTYRAAGPNSFAPGSADATNAYNNNATWLYWSDGGTANTNLDGYYINDVWTISNNFQLSAGIRFDKVSSSDTLGSKVISSSQTSPRLQLTYDLRGDQSWVARASWARYTSKLQDGFANQFTLAGNPIEEDYSWRGAAATNLTVAQVQDLANWDLSVAGLRYVGSPVTNTINPNTKSPYADEISLGLRRSLTDGGFISFTYAQRTFKNFFNDFLNVGQEINVPLRAVPGATSRAILTTWGNDDRLKRDYKSFEIEFMSKFNGNWSMGGNYTYSILKGNGEGSEGQSSTLAVSGDVIGNYTGVHDARGRDESYFAPYGYLAGDVTHRASIHLDYVSRTEHGATFTSSLLFNYNPSMSANSASQVYSLTRTNGFEARTDATTAGSTIASAYPTTYTRYYGPRGIGRFNDNFNFDWKVGLEVPLFGKARYFAEITVLNVFNHWQLVSYSASNTAGSASLVTNAPNAGYYATAWSSSDRNRTGYGTYGFGDYTGGRSLRLSTGFKW